MNLDEIRQRARDGNEDAVRLLRQIVEGGPDLSDLDAEARHNRGRDATRRDYEQAGNARLKCECGATTPRGIVIERETGYELRGVCYATQCYTTLISNLAGTRTAWRWAIGREIKEARIVELRRPRWRNLPSG